MKPSDKDDFLKYEKNFSHRKLALIVLGTGNRSNIRAYLVDGSWCISAGRLHLCEEDDPPTKASYVRDEF